MSVLISDVIRKSICAHKGIKPGDKLISINDNEINDVLDYRFYADEDNLKIKYINKKGHLKTCSVKHSEGVDNLGLEFETYLMDKQQQCKNACIFCFIDQMPKGMRSSLYFKDDDSRLSFLFGNYITMTNLSETDVERIIKMHISPLNASVHTMNPELRVKMMKNPKAADSLNYLKKFSDAGIAINAQLVLCPGINDGAELDYSLSELSKLKSIKSIAAVPVGLTKYREGLFPLKSYNADEAGDVIDRIDAFNNQLVKSGKEKIAYPSDEFFQLAERKIPDVEYYGDFLQLDNGVGLYALTKQDFISCLRNEDADKKNRQITVATGKAAYSLICELSHLFSEKYVNSKIDVVCINNEFFGENVTVAGLITGQDLIKGLIKKINTDSVLFIPSVMLKGPDEPIFLDDISIDDVKSALGVNIEVISTTGDELFYSFLEKGERNV